MMIPVNIISKVEIPPIDQEVVENLLRAEIVKANPEVHINSIEFIQRINPKRIEVVVDAQLGAPVVKAAETVTEQNVVTEPVKEEEQLPLDLTPAEDVSTSVEDIFKLPGNA